METDSHHGTIRITVKQRIERTHLAVYRCNVLTYLAKTFLRIHLILTREATLIILVCILQVRKQRNGLKKRLMKKSN